MIRFDVGDQRFNYRVAGLATDGSRVLLEHAASTGNWYLPGGRCELGEPAAETLRREMVEELGAAVEVGRLLWIAENFFTRKGKAYHEVLLVFEMAFAPDASVVGREGRFAGIEADAAGVYEWRDTADVPGLPFVPTFLRDALGSRPATPAHVVHRG